MEIPLSPERVTTRAAAKRFAAERHRDLRAKQARRTKAQPQHTRPAQPALEAALAELDAVADGAFESLASALENHIAVNPHHSLTEAWNALVDCSDVGDIFMVDWTMDSTVSSSGESTPFTARTPTDLDAARHGLRVQQEQPAVPGAGLHHAPEYFAPQASPEGTLRRSPRKKKVA
ncbi:hypothetical protein PsYK624_042100 [Phanerochaete sordida]|uniref:Uncharacterized protein n=1 Tax=Phanerochaete sordida TaxID=48140 RepID=A0A9P3G4U3_9APHY|nr:hypothetical protein PsYK624_042100 [Phanerochaete sordida]